ncbi:hypothetical protein [Marinomonas pollencensis]|uniref:Uncharacterized protein n=1 Tax=Marinomonas pollencensis TaxID=491954 RepID=A0A3E0DNQ0_9GAMM|nr:hypothetical protein [Marinomonas pollencensis]REG84343.1 hypothetical protein DFP81_104222 [Marinomonas pollencensis]
MHLDKAKKRIAKQVKKGFKGYPAIELEYFGSNKELATEVVIRFTMEEGDACQEQRFNAKNDVREDETIQSVLVKIMERADAKSVTEVAGVTLL